MQRPRPHQRLLAQHGQRDRGGFRRVVDEKDVVLVAIRGRRAWIVADLGEVNRDAAAIGQHVIGNGIFETYIVAAGTGDVGQEKKVAARQHDASTRVRGAELVASTRAVIHRHRAVALGTYLELRAIASRHPHGALGYEVHALAFEHQVQLVAARWRSLVNGGIRRLSWPARWPPADNGRVASYVRQRHLPSQPGGTHATLLIRELDRHRHATSRGRQVQCDGRAVAARGVHRAREPGIRWAPRVVGPRRRQLRERWRSCR